MGRLNSFAAPAFASRHCHPSVSLRSPFGASHGSRPSFGPPIEGEEGARAPLSPRLLSHLAIDPSPFDELRTQDEPFDRSTSSRLRVGKRGAWPCLPNFIRGAASAPRRRFLSPPGPLLVTGSGAAFWPCPARKPRHGRPIRLDLPRPRLCARPARTGRSARRGPLGRNLPGRQATLARRRRRRSFPAKHRRELRSRREGRGHYAGGL